MVCKQLKGAEPDFGVLPLFVLCGDFMPADAGSWNLPSSNSSKQLYDSFSAKRMDRPCAFFHFAMVGNPFGYEKFIPGM